MRLEQLLQSGFCIYVIYFKGNPNSQNPYIGLFREGSSTIYFPFQLLTEKSIVHVLGSSRIFTDEDLIQYTVVGNDAIRNYFPAPLSVATLYRQKILAIAEKIQELEKKDNTHQDANSNLKQGEINNGNIQGA